MAAILRDIDHVFMGNRVHSGSFRQQLMETRRRGFHRDDLSRIFSSSDSIVEVDREEFGELLKKST